MTRVRLLGNCLRIRSSQSHSAKSWESIQLLGWNGMILLQYCPSILEWDKNGSFSWRWAWWLPFVRMIHHLRQQLASNLRPRWQRQRTWRAAFLVLKVCDLSWNLLRNVVIQHWRSFLLSHLHWNFGANWTIWYATFGGKAHVYPEKTKTFMFGYVQRCHFTSQSSKWKLF